MDHTGIAEEMVAAFGTDRLVTRLTDRLTGFSLEDGYDVAHLVRDLRVARGEVPVGRKIGGTNRATYHLTGATGPMWSFMYSSTVCEVPTASGRFAIGQFPQPRIEPELVLHLCAAPQPGMDEAELLDCVDRVAHGFEFVFSPFSSWQVLLPDAVAAHGLHFGAFVGPWADISGDRAGWSKLLKTFVITLEGSNGEVRQGAGANALGSPVLALKAIVDEIGAHPEWTPLESGEIVTTGTLTELMPMIPGERWKTTIIGAPLAGLTVTLD
jgi:2-oxo-3-hexenedioate decarboxylase